MPNTVTLQVLHDGPRKAIVKLNISGDNSGDETARLVLDISEDLAMGERTEVRLDRVSADLSDFSAALLWDATADVRAVDLPSGDSDNDYRDIGGLRNNAGAGKTGDINLETTGLATDDGTIILYLSKVEGRSASF